jgi:ribosome recycling factor
VKPDGGGIREEGASCVAKENDAGLNDVVEDAALRMMGAVEAFEDKLRTVRTGRATPALVEHVRVKCYGTESPLRTVAGIAVPEPRLIMLRPYDPSIIADIEKAIIAADLGLNPQNDGKVVRIPIPPLTEERRRDLVKVVEREAEAARVAVRNVRRDANKVIDALRKGGEFPEDDCANAKESVQGHTDEQEQAIDERLAKKRDEIMDI